MISVSPCDLYPSMIRAKYNYDKKWDFNEFLVESMKTSQFEKKNVPLKPNSEVDPSIVKIATDLFAFQIKKKISLELVCLCLGDSVKPSSKVGWSIFKFSIRPSQQFWTIWRRLVFGLKEQLNLIGLTKSTNSAALEPNRIKKNPNLEWFGWWPKLLWGIFETRKNPTRVVVWSTSGLMKSNSDVGWSMTGIAIRSKRVRK